MIIEVQDQLRHYSLENGEAYAVALTAKGTVETARVIHHLSPTNTAAVGRLMMGALLTASDIKAENGDVTCAIDGGGPAGKVLAVASPKGTVRAAIENPEADLPIRQTDGKLDVSGILGHAGRLTVVKDNGGREPYMPDFYRRYGRPRCQRKKRRGYGGISSAGMPGGCLAAVGTTRNGLWAAFLYAIRRNDAGGCCAVYFLGYADGTDADRAGMLSMQL